MPEPYIPNVVAPQCNINGTAREVLIDDRLAATGALQTALDALHAMAPNGRDYQIRPDEMGEAIQQHCRRLEAVNQVLDELYREVELIQG